MEIPSSDFLRFIPQPDLLRQTFMECQGTRFATTVICHFTQSYEAARTGDGDDMAVVTFEHCRQEFANSPPMRQCVDLKDHADHRLGFVQNGALFADTGIVD